LCQQQKYSNAKKTTDNSSAFDDTEVSSLQTVVSETWERIDKLDIFLNNQNEMEDRRQGIH